VRPPCTGGRRAVAQGGGASGAGWLAASRTFIISFCIACIVFLMSPTLTRRFIAPMTSLLFTMCPITFCCAAGGTPTALSGMRQ